MVAGAVWDEERAPWRLTAGLQIASGHQGGSLGCRTTRGYHPITLPRSVPSSRASSHSAPLLLLPAQVPTTSSRRASQLELAVMAAAAPSLAAAAAAAAASRRASAVAAGRRATLSGYRRSGSGLRRSTLQSVFAHGALASIPLDGRR